MPVLEAIDLVANPSSPPLTLSVTRGEIVGLLFPPGRARAATLRVLAGLDAAVAGEVRFPGHRRVVVSPAEQPLSAALSLRPDLVLLDVANDVGDRNTWARFASERAHGTSFVVATASLDEACRADRVALASWDTVALARATAELVRRMTSLTQEFLAVFGEARHRRTVSLAGDLRRLNVGARVLLAEMGRLSRSGDETLAWRTASGDVAGVSLDDRVLDAAMVEAQER